MLLNKIICAMLPANYKILISSKCLMHLLTAIGLVWFFCLMAYQPL